MSESIRFQCCGSSISNAKTCLQEQIIGFKAKFNIPEGEKIYVMVKVDDDWMVCGSGVVSLKTDKNPFPASDKIKCLYSLSDVEYCEPFSIKEQLKEMLGSSWGLIVQSPKAITSPEFIAYIEASFHKSNVMKF